MKPQNRLLNLLFISIAIFMLSACDKEKETKIDINTTTPVVSPKSLKVTIDKTTLKVEATYADGSTKELHDDMVWIVTPQNAVQVNNTTLIAKKDGNVTLQAKVGTTLSNKVTLNIYWEVNGHRLPPEPDPVKNNATLLGIDSNNNGVRDDVERWIYETYDSYIPCHQELDYNNTVEIDGEMIPSAVQVCEEHPVPYHPVVRAVAMQGARAAQIIIQEPEKAREFLPVLDKALNCDSYITTWSKITDKKVYTQETDIVFSKRFKKIQFNTVQRARAFAEFNFYLSGGVFESVSTKKMLEGCSAEVKALLKDLK